MRYFGERVAHYSQLKIPDLDKIIAMNFKEIISVLEKKLEEYNANSVLKVSIQWIRMYLAQRYIPYYYIKHVWILEDQLFAQSVKRINKT
jgi:isoleucyl-tRNA synthetase